MARKRLKPNHLKRCHDSVYNNYSTFTKFFPEEIWEFILDNLESAEDIQNVLLTYPQLGSVFHYKKPSWLFAQVFPHLLKYISLGQKHVLVLRSVSKRWCNAVDNLLERYFHLPSNPSETSSHLVPYREFSSVTYKHSQESFPCVKLSTIEQIQTFQKQLSKFPNPNFVGRQLKIYQEYFAAANEQEKGRLHRHAVEFLDATLHFLKKFGRLISTLTLRFGRFYSSDAAKIEEIVKKLIKCLSYIPNVRSLNLYFGFDLDDSSFEDITDIYSTNSKLLRLPHLETFKFHEDFVDCGNSLNLFLKGCSRHSPIKSLGMPLVCWNKKYRDYFPELIQLDIDALVSESYKKLSYILNPNGFPALKKLVIRPSILFKPLNLTELFVLLVPLRVDELEIINERVGARVIVQNELEISPHPVSSIRHLSFTNCNEIEFEFLRILPSVQNFSLFVHAPQGLDHGLQLHRDGLSLTSQIRAYLLKRISSNVNIWKELPELNFFTIGNETCLRQYARETGNKCFHVQF